MSDFEDRVRRQILLKTSGIELKEKTKLTGEEKKEIQRMANEHIKNSLKGETNAKTKKKFSR